MNIKSYQDRCLEKLNTLSGEELTRILKEVFDIKENDMYAVHVEREKQYGKHRNTKN